MKNKLTQLFTDFLNSEQTSGIILIMTVIVALLAANSRIGETFMAFWHIKVGFDLGIIHMRYDFEHWINDGLMAVFFLLIGLEIEREVYLGELSNLKNASLPIFAAIGGMVTPPLLHFIFNQGTQTESGFGIPMATDIAFALGVLALLGKRVPNSLKIFLTAFAIIDDLGAIIVITVFYSRNLSFVYLILALVIFAILLQLNRRGVHSLTIYLILGFIMWYVILQSGIHASIAGVLLAFAIPFSGGNELSPSYRLERFLHKPVAYFIMPLFALANTGIVTSLSSISSLLDRNSIGIFVGLFVGKPLGIVLFSSLAVRMGLSKFPDGIHLRHIIGVGFLGGIGFTMSIFITFLAFGDTQIAQFSKLAILISSLCAATMGLILLGIPFSSSSAIKKVAS